MSRDPEVERQDWSANPQKGLGEEPAAPPTSSRAADGRTTGPGGQPTLNEMMLRSFHSLKTSGKLFIAGCVIGFVVLSSLKLDDRGIAEILVSWRAMGACGSIHCAVNALAQCILILELPLSLLALAVTFAAIRTQRDTLACVCSVMLAPSLGQLMLVDRWRWPAALTCGAIHLWLIRDIGLGQGKWIYFGAFAMSLMLVRLYAAHRRVARSGPEEVR